MTTDTESEDQDVLFSGDEELGAESPIQNQEEKSSESEVEGRYRISPLTLTVFKRETDSGVFRNFQLQRTYTTDDGDSFDYTDSLRPRDLRKAARLFELAADDVQGLKRQSADGNRGGG